MLRSVGAKHVIIGHSENRISGDNNNIINLKIKSALKEKLKIIKEIKSSKINFIKPLGFFDYVNLQKKSFITLSDSGTLSEESSIINFPSVSIRTSTERPEAIDYGTMVLGNIDSDSITQSINVALKLYKNGFKQIPVDYKVLNSSDRVIKIIQGYTKIINREIWKK